MLQREDFAVKTALKQGLLKTVLDAYMTRLTSDAGDNFPRAAENQ
jgi:hypothetical protein